MKYLTDRNENAFDPTSAYENWSRQQVQVREDVSGSEVEGQERRGRCRLSATREEMPQHKYEEIEWKTWTLKTSKQWCDIL